MGVSRKLSRFRIESFSATSRRVGRYRRGLETNEGTNAPVEMREEPRLQWIPLIRILREDERKPSWTLSARASTGDRYSELRRLALLPLTRPARKSRGIRLAFCAKEPEKVAREKAKVANKTHLSCPMEFCDVFEHAMLHRVPSNYWNIGAPFLSLLKTSIFAIN